MPKENKMKARKSVVLGLALVALLIVATAVTRVGALRDLVRSYSNQIFYSSSVEEVVHRESAAPVSNQVFYSPSIEEIVHRNNAAPVSNQEFYSPSIEEIVNLESAAPVTN